MKQMFVDVETSGLRYDKHGLIQLSVIIVIDGQEKDRFDFKMKPFTGDMLDPKALKVNRVTVEELRSDSRMEPEEAYKEFINLLGKYVSKFEKKDKFFFLAYNAPFDVGFVRKFFEKNGDNYFGSWFWSVPLCVMVLAQEKLKEVRHEMENFKLATVAEKMGIEFDPASLHDAMADVELTMELYGRVEG